jgi:hypothetical protein
MSSAAAASSAGGGGGGGGGGVGGAGDGRGDGGAMSPPCSDDDSARQKLLRRRRAPGESPSRGEPPAPAPGRGAPARATSLPAGGGISDGEEDGLCDAFSGEGPSDAAAAAMSESASLVGSRVSFASSVGGTDCASPPDAAPGAAAGGGGGGGGGGADEGPEVPLRSSLERAASHPPRPGVKRALLPPSNSSFSSSFSASLGVSAAGGGGMGLGLGGGGNPGAHSPPRARVHPHPHPHAQSPSGWRLIPGPFHVVAAAVISCRNDAAPHGIAPRAALADGCADLIAVRACSRPAYLRHLLRLARPRELGDHLEMPFVTAVKARAVRFTPAPASASAASRWNCDGELLPHGANAMTATVAAGLLTMLAFTPDDVK